ncbi:MAG: FHA domain-containing protein [Planctomycetes bacterium]|nr:FHA domain-containing protein [Planctomycetota bacterium]
MRIQLRVLNGKSAGREMNVPHAEYLIGRSDECHLRPKSDAISRRHCVVRTRDDKVFAEDLGSKNGTYVNGVRLEGETEVHNGDVFRVGRFEFELLVGDPVALPSAASDQQEETKSIVGEDSWAEDNDITKWLEEGGAAKYIDPATRQLQLEPAEKAALETTMLDQTAAQTIGGPGTAATDPKTDPGKAEKKKPGKLPPRAGTATNNSREAAADMLKKFFNRP